MTSVDVDIAIVGGGPAGLAVALEAAARGVSARVFERRPGPVDKACGEGVMPPGLSALDRLGVLPLIEPSDTSVFDSITYVQEDGRSVRAKLPAPGGLGIRRLALGQAMTRRACDLGVAIHQACAVRAHRFDAEGVTLSTDVGEVRAQVLVAADGLHSPLRKALGLERSWAGPKRFGLRRHVAIAPWAATVEVHFAAGVEAYVTPAGAHRVGIAFLWEDGRLPGPISFDALLAHFPPLAERVAGHPFDSEVKGAGPLRQPVTGRIRERFVLVGDAAGYVDAITGEGLSLAFAGAATLGRLWPDILRQRGALASLEPYEREMRRQFNHCARVAGALVWAARRPWLRRFIVNRLIASPPLFEWALRTAV